MSNLPQTSVSPEHYRERLSAEVDGLRRQVEQLRQHVQAVPPTMHPQHPLYGTGSLGMSQQQRQQQMSRERANLIASFPPSRITGQEMPAAGASGMQSAVATQMGLSKDDISNMLRGKQQAKAAQLAKILEDRRKLQADLETLERQRIELMEDSSGGSGGPAAIGQNLLDLQDPGGARFPPLRSTLPQNHLAGGFVGSRMHGGQNIPSSFGFARESLQRYPHSMPFPGGGPGLGMGMSKPGEPPLDPNTSFGSSPPAPNAGYASPSQGTQANIGSETLDRQQYKSKRSLDQPESPQEFEKRRRLLAETALREELQKRQMGAMFPKPNPGMRMSQFYPPNEIMVSDRANTPVDAISALSSSHQLLASQREANLQRENMMFYQGMNRGNMLPSLRDHMIIDRKLPDTKRKLPKSFAPEPNTVVLGKGNIPKTNFGNLKLKGIVMEHLSEYANGERRKKIAVISRIIRHVTNSNYATTGFVKFEDDTWWEMTERDARVKITALFRDCLHDQYRSSSSSKVKRRQELRKREITGAIDSDNDKTKKDDGAEKKTETEQEEGS